ncbi:MAG: LysR family transcriptional regulator [Bacteroidales bacterium]|nr:LysR family transcriptional regulator [Bacteroidales bacterium]
MFEDSRINVFMAVCEEGSFTKAAKRLGISQPAVSQNISEIEKGVGARLFDRNRNALAITEEGKLFKEFASQILYWYKTASESFRSSSAERLARGERPRRDLRIGISDDYRCFLVPQGSEDVDIDVQSMGKGMSVRVIQKVTEPEGPATLLF